MDLYFQFKKSDVHKKELVVEDLLRKYNRLSNQDKLKYENIQEYLQDQDMKLKIITRKIEHDEKVMAEKEFKGDKTQKYKKLLSKAKLFRKKRSKEREERNQKFKEYIESSRRKRDFQRPLIFNFEPL